MDTRERPLLNNPSSGEMLAVDCGSTCVVFLGNADQGGVPRRGGMLSKACGWIRTQYVVYSLRKDRFSSVGSRSDGIDTRL